MFGNLSREIPEKIPESEYSGKFSNFREFSSPISPEQTKGRVSGEFFQDFELLKPLLNTLPNTNKFDIHLYTHTIASFDKFVQDTMSCLKLFTFSERLKIQKNKK